jgi:phospholipase/carboxylesterase
MHSRGKSCRFLTTRGLRTRSCTHCFSPMPARDESISRRHFLAAVLSAATAAGCGTPVNGSENSGYGRLSARPANPGNESIGTGLNPLGLESGRDGLLYVPATHQRGQKLPLVVYLHGAGGSSVVAVGVLQSEAESRGFALLVPDSRDFTWDIIRFGVYGPDVSYINRALEKVFSGLTIDASKIVLAGFSDGASYVLSLGLTNGDLFSRLIAFSPCILEPAETRGSPQIFISHGTSDEILNIDRCGQRLTTELRASGRTVVLEEFDGGHTIPAEVKTHALEWAGLSRA